MRILEYFIKNDTPYIGKLILKLEKKPDYNDIKKGYLNKIHLNLFFFKLVSRLIPNIKNDSLELLPDAITLVEKYTRCSLVKKIQTDPESPSGRFFTYNLIYDKKHYWGDLDFGWWMFKNGIIVSEEYPKNIAFIYKNKEIIGTFIKVKNETFFLNIGDRIFEENYQPNNSFHDKKEWKLWMSELKKDLEKVDSVHKLKIYKEGLRKYVPLQKRGRAVIKNKEDLLKSSKNIVKYFIKKNL